MNSKTESRIDKELEKLDIKKAFIESPDFRDTERDIKRILNEAEKFSERCDTRLLNVLPDLKSKIESLEGSENYDEYLNRFYEIRDSFKLDCLCGKKARIESEQDKEQEASFSSSEGEMSWLGTDIKERLAEVMEYHKKGKK